MGSTLEMFVVVAQLLSLVAGIAGMMYFPKYRPLLNRIVVGMTIVLSAYVTWNIAFIFCTFFGLFIDSMSID